MEIEVSHGLFSRIDSINPTKQDAWEQVWQYIQMSLTQGKRLGERTPAKDSLVGCAPEPWLDCFRVLHQMGGPDGEASSKLMVPCYSTPFVLGSGYHLPWVTTCHVHMARSHLQILRFLMPTYNRWMFPIFVLLGPWDFLSSKTQCQSVGFLSWKTAPEIVSRVPDASLTSPLNWKTSS